MYQDLGDWKSRVPIHEVLLGAIQKEWWDPVRKPFFSRSLKWRFPFNDDAALICNKFPMLDAPFCQMSKNNYLAFEDMGALRDPLDKRMDALPKKGWEFHLSEFETSHGYNGGS